MTLLRPLSKLLCFLLIVAGFSGRLLGALHWSFDLLATPLHLYLLGLFGFTLLWLITRQGRWLALTTLSALILATPFLPYYLPQAKNSAEPPHLRLYVHNLYFMNNDLPAAVAQIRQHDPDVLFLMEYSDAIQAQIEAEFADYPYTLIQPSRMTMGLAIFSRIPLENPQIHRSEATRIPIFQVEMQINGQTVTMIGAHPWPPLPFGTTNRAQIEQITAISAQLPHPLIVAGDFNATPWSHALGQLSRQSLTHDARHGFGWQPTWWFTPDLPIALSLDHIFISSEWRVIQFQQGQRGASDHAPLILDLFLESTATSG